MLRGWVHARKQAAPMPVLAALLISGGMLWAHHVKASTLDVASFERELVNQVFMVEGKTFEPVVVTEADGSMRVETNLGTFEGQWNMVDQTICIYFDDGPKAGETCGKIRRIAEGRYETSFGDRLTLLKPSS